MQLTTPLQQTERAAILDVLRGIAILGILLNNIYSFSGYGMLTDEMRELNFSTFNLDQLLNLLQIIFVEGKFYTLFSLLFGIGFSIFLLRGEAKGINPLKIFYPRLIILAVIGFLHLYFIWFGDILLLYALIGLVLPLFRKCSNRTLITWAVVLILCPILIDIIKVATGWSAFPVFIPLAMPTDIENGITEDNWRTLLFNEDSGFKEWGIMQDTGYIYRYADLIESNRFFKVLGIFILGLYVGRNRIYSNLGQYKPLLKKVRKWGFIIGLPFSIAMGIFEGDDHYVPMHWEGLFDTVSYAFGVVPLSLAYTATIALLWNRKNNNSRLRYFAPAGRMALTNYILQTVVGSFLFYAAGFGLGQEFGLVYVFLIALAIYIFQILYSTLWLKYFQYGPLEWIWRMLTYRKWLPIRKASTASTA